MRKGNIEFRSSDFNKGYELVKWNSQKNCHVAAFFIKSKEGYDMQTVGDRFFEDHDAWIVGKHALAFLNDIFDQEEPEAA